MNTNPRRIADLIVKAKLEDMGDIKEGTADGAYRNAIIDIISSIDWDFEEESIKALEESFEDKE